jgi:hypothetical protein
MLYLALFSLMIALVVFTLGMVGVVKGAAGVVAIAFCLFLLSGAMTLVTPGGRFRIGRRRRPRMA